MLLERPPQTSTPCKLAYSQSRDQAGNIWGALFCLPQWPSKNVGFGGSKERDWEEKRRVFGACRPRSRAEVHRDVDQAVLLRMRA